MISISLDKLARIEGELNPSRALELARKLVSFYNEHPELPFRNKIYARLHLSTSLMLVDSLHAALHENFIALNYSKLLKDEDVMSNVYIELSSLYGELGKKDSCLHFAKMACSKSKADTITCRLALASAFCDVDSLT